MAKLERDYQKKLIKKIKETFPNAMVLKNDPNYIQGVPDLLILNGKNWAALEVKRSARAPHRPNQDYYVERMNKMSYASFVYPANQTKVISSLKSLFGKRTRKSRTRN